MSDLIGGMSITKDKKDPYALYQKLIKIKDLNKLAEIVSNPYETLGLRKYFSVDIFDKSYITYKNFPKKKH